MKRQTALTIDRIRCDGHGHWAELLPELIRLDNWGYPITESGPVTKQLSAHPKRAVASCPVLALALRRREATDR